MRIIVDDLTGPQIAAFLAEHVAQLRAVTPPGSSHALDLDALRQPSVTFWVVRGDDDQLLGCGAIKALSAEHAELKSMRTATDRKRGGVASALLSHILAEATRQGFTRISLETGSFEFFAPARALYEKFGFTYTGPFGNYQADPNSVFMTRALP